MYKLVKVSLTDTKIEFEKYFFYIDNCKNYAKKDAGKNLYWENKTPDLVISKCVFPYNYQIHYFDTEDYQE